MVVGHDARLQLDELVPASPNVDIVMNEFNLNFILLQTTSKSIIVREDLDRFLTEKWMVNGGVSERSGRG
jgi:hypothetical protein